MPARRAVKAVPKISTLAALSDEFEERRFRIRGIEYLIREIDTKEYDDLVTKATSTKVDSNGDDQEVIDNRLLLRMMTEASLVSPRTLPKGMRARRALENEVNNLHFGLEPIERPNADGEYPSDKKVDDGLDDDEDDEDTDPNESAG